MGLVKSIKDFVEPLNNDSLIVEVSNTSKLFESQVFTPNVADFSTDENDGKKLGTSIVSWLNGAQKILDSLNEEGSVSPRTIRSLNIDLETLIAGNYAHREEILKVFQRNLSLALSGFNSSEPDVRELARVEIFENAMKTLGVVWSQEDPDYSLGFILDSGIEEGPLIEGWLQGSLF